MKKKLLSVVLCVAMVAVLLMGCAKNPSQEGPVEPVAGEDAGDDNEKDVEPKGDDSEKEPSGDLIVVGYAQVGAESDWRMANTESFKDTFVEENGYDLIFVDGQQKQENQIKAIRDFIQQDVDYIVLAPVVETGWETVLGEAKEAGIPVILSDRMVEVSDDSLYTSWVGGNFVKEGEDGAKWLEGYLKDQGREGDEINLVTLQGTIGASAQVGRTEGFGKILDSHDNWNMLELQTGEFTQTKGQEVMESFLKKYDDIDVVVCENDNMAFGAIDAIKAAGKTCGPDGDIIIISFDAVKAAFESMIAGDMNVSVECNPLHGPRVSEIIDMIEKGETPDKIAYVDEEVFPAETAAEILPSRAY